MAIYSFNVYKFTAVVYIVKKIILAQQYLGEISCLNMFPFIIYIIHVCVLESAHDNKVYCTEFHREK